MGMVPVKYRPDCEVPGERGLAIARRGAAGVTDKRWCTAAFVALRPLLGAYCHERVASRAHRPAHASAWQRPAWPGGLARLASDAPEAGSPRRAVGIRLCQSSPLYLSIPWFPRQQGEMPTTRVSLHLSQE